MKSKIIKIRAISLLLIKNCVELVHLILSTLDKYVDKLDKTLAEQLCKVEELLNKIPKK